MPADQRNDAPRRVGGAVLPDADAAMGQGIATSYAQLAVDTFGVPIERIRILQGDTDRANGFGSAGSRSLFTGGAAVCAAALRLVDWLDKDQEPTGANGAEDNEYLLNSND